MIVTIVTCLLLPVSFLTAPTTRLSSKPTYAVSMNYTRSELLGDLYGFAGGALVAQIAFHVADADRRAKSQGVEKSLDLLQRAEKERQSPERFSLPR